MTLNFSMNYKDELMMLILDNDYNVVKSEVKNLNMSECVIKPAVPRERESLLRFFRTNMGGGADTEIKAYIEHIRKHGFYNPYERNLRIEITDD